MNRTWRIGLALALTLGASGCGFFGREEIAFVRALKGDVQVRQENAEASQPADVGTGLVEGDIISTGENGTTTLDFKGGNEINLNPGTSLVIRRTGSTAAEVGAVLLSGSAQVSSRGKGVTLTIGTPIGLTTIGVGEVVLEMGAETGVVVTVGKIMVEIDGKEVELTAGSSLTLDGLVVPAGKKADDTPAEGIVLNPIEVTLLANNKQVQVKRAGQETWEAPKKRDVLAAGDAIRTRGATGTSLQVGESSQLVMDANSELTLNKVSQAATGVSAEYEVKNGGTQIVVRNTGKGDSHKVKVGDAVLEVIPGPQTAKVDVDSNANGRATVDVHFGKVKLSDGTVIEAGSTANLKNGELVGEVAARATSAIVLRPKLSSEVHYVGSVPPVSFEWGEGKNDAARVLEVATDKDFQRLVFAEEVSRSSFVHDRLDPGRYYWRVGRGEEWERGTFKIQKHETPDCDKCRRNNDIPDNGERAVVYYQEKLPAITLRWKPVGGAASYQARVFADGDFDTPAVEETTTETHQALAAGRLKEGKYYWLVKALDGAGKEVSTGRMNSLEIAFDNAITDLKITYPRQNERVGGKRLTTSGAVQLGAKIFVDGKPVGVDEQGRFRGSLNLEKGLNRIVYRTLAKDGIERYYFRDVHKR